MRVTGRVRGILGKHFIDIDRLRINCTRGIVRIMGTFSRLGDLDDVMPITEKILNDLKMEIVRLPDVRRVMLVQDDDVPQV